MKVHIHQKPESIPPASGIGRVVWSQYKHLPLYGVELVSDHRQADVITAHTDIYQLPRIDCIAIHGLYWNGDPGSGSYNNSNFEINKRIIAAVRKSLIVTVPSEWVGECWKRDLRINPIVVPHGIDLEEWNPSPRMDDYIVWGKNRAADVCDPTPAWELASRGYNVVSTFAPRGKVVPLKMSITGAVPGNEMRDLMAGAYIYLATTKETFGIQTIEAMALAKPVLGFDWGGTRDIVTHKKDGYLVRPYDYDALEQGAEWIHQNYASASQAARHTAEGYTWEKAMRKYVNVYEMAAQGIARERVSDGCAVVVTSYNYAHWLPEALRSILHQQLYASEVIVVDDASTDTTSEVAESFRQQFEMEGMRYKVIRHETNQGVAAARNHGVQASTSPYVVCLDADDRLNPFYLRACRDAMVKDRSVGIAYSGLGVIQPDGNVHTNVWTGAFDWEWQAGASVPPHTTIPTAAMFRRTLWERSGGYRQKYAPGEDAEFYTRGLSLGFTAVKVSESPFIEYRNHGGGAHIQRKYIATDDDKPWMRDRMYPIGAPSERPPLVRSYSDPLVSVCITGIDVAIAYVTNDTIESVVGQTWREWELVIESVPHANLMMQRYPFIHTKATAPLCITIATGTVLPNDYLQTRLEQYVALSDVTKWLEDDTMGKSCCGGMDAKEIAKLQMLKQGEMTPLDATTPQGASRYTDPNEGNMIIRGDFVRMEYIGPHVGASTFLGRNGTNRQYRGGNNPMEKYADIHKEDVEKLSNTGDWRVVRVERSVREKEKERDAQRTATPAPSDSDAGTLRSDGSGVVAGDDVLHDRERERVTPFGLRLPPVSAPVPDESGQVKHLASKPLIAVEATGEKRIVSPPEPPPPAKWAKIEIPSEALGELAGEEAIEEVPPPVDAVMPVERVLPDNQWPTQDEDNRIKQEISKRRKRGA